VPFPAACSSGRNSLTSTLASTTQAALATALVRDVQGEGDSTRAIPDLAVLECGNVFWKRVRRGLLPADLAVESLADLLALPLVVWPARELVERALELAVSLDVSLYDAAYLALADTLDIPLVTADEALARKVGERGFGARCSLLGDFADARADP
jgi:predicted nucleic acid-binding protein